MELRRYFYYLLRWWWLVAIGIVVAAGTAYYVSRTSVPVYQASTKLLIDQSKQATTDYNSILTSERLSQTYVEWLRTQPVLDEVIKRMQLPFSAADLAAAVNVTPVRNTQLLVIAVEDTDPARAAAIANMLPVVFREQSGAMQAQRFKEAKAGVEGQRTQLQAEIAQTQADLDRARTDNNAADTERLRGALAEMQSTDNALAQSLASIRLEESKSTDSIFVIEQAKMPVSPIRPKTTQNTLLAAIVGAMLALGVIFLLEYLNDTLQNPDDVTESLGLATLTAVPAAAATTSELSAVQGGHKGSAEAYRILRTNLQFAAVGGPLRRVLVTSPSPKEGKSYTSANLAVALAQGERQVILVDGDLHRPRQHRLLELPNNVGLTTALVEPETDPLSLLQETKVPGLRVLTSGPLPPNPSEMLGSARMKELLDVLSREADIIVLDTPPVLAVADAAVLASETDGVLLVVDAGSTQREMARRALASLEKVHARLLGVVLNRVSERQAGYSYYYYYYYDQEGSADGAEGKQRRRHRRRRAPGAATPSSSEP